MVILKGWCKKSIKEKKRKKCEKFWKKKIN